jgi:hypothetical protein
VCVVPTVERGTNASLGVLHGDLRAIFGERLQCLLAYGAGIAIGRRPSGVDQSVHSLALVDRISFSDLTACAVRTGDWKRLGLGVPLILSRDEFVRSLDAFPLEYGAIIATHVVIGGEDPFRGIAVAPDDVRRACEVQAKSHLIHLREGYLEAEGEPTALAALVGASAPAFAALAVNIARLHGTPETEPPLIAKTLAQLTDASPVALERIFAALSSPPMSGAEAASLYPAYLDASERLWRYIDQWRSDRP